ncbi:CocE/NonD family hydrolase [Corynebacterium variabile]|uniref:CocE/NonD family hydrolase n=1 Tax=Corynebacterium variabile TaxID=1727 RepID=UPI00373529D3
MDIIHVPPAPVAETAIPLRVRMRDGVHLASDLYLPEGDTLTDPGDTILIRLPYDKSGSYTFIPQIAAHMVRRGYRVLAQDVRGKFRSEGETLLFVNEQRDGYDTLAWIEQQTWSNGRVAMWGDSYYGFTQWAAVASQHPALKAIAPRVTGTMLGEPVHPVGDVRNVEWAVSYLYPLTYFHSQDAYFWEPDPTVRPISAECERAIAEIGSRSISYDQWYPSPVFLRRFPDGHPFDARPVPTLQTVGLWDNCAPLSWADIGEIEQRPAWSHNHFLRIEAIDHEGFFFDDPAEVRVEEPSAELLDSRIPAMIDPSLDFFDIVLRGQGSLRDVPKVTWDHAGTGETRTSEAWPPAGTSVRTWEIGDAGTATWTHDPADLVPSSVENAFGYLMDHPDEAPVGEHKDVLVWDGETVDAAVDFVGPVSAHAVVGSDGPCMDFFVRLLDVDPDGTALRIARGQVHVADTTAGPVDVTVDMGQLGYRLHEGHRLRVHVSSSDFPEFVPLPGTGEDPWGAVEMQENHQSVVLGGDAGFRIDLTVLKSVENNA